MDGVKNEELEKVEQHVRLRLEASRTVLIHNDLINTAFHFLTRAREIDAAGNRGGIALEIQAGLVFLAFSVEAYTNFLGQTICPADFKEKDAIETKIAFICEKLALPTPDYGRRPHQSLKTLTSFRNDLAHGKPSVLKAEQIKTGPVGRWDNLDISPEAGWEKVVRLDVFENSYADVDIVWKQWLDASGLSIFDTLSTGERGATFIEYVEPPSRLGG